MLRSWPTRPGSHHTAECRPQSMHLPAHRITACSHRVTLRAAALTSAAVPAAGKQPLLSDRLPSCRRPGLCCIGSSTSTSSSSIQGIAIASIFRRNRGSRACSIVCSVSTEGDQHISSATSSCHHDHQPASSSAAAAAATSSIATAAVSLTSSTTASTSTGPQDGKQGTITNTNSSSSSSHAQRSGTAPTPQQRIMMRINRSTSLLELKHWLRPKHMSTMDPRHVAAACVKLVHGYRQQGWAPGDCHRLLSFLIKHCVVQQPSPQPSNTTSANAPHHPGGFGGLELASVLRAAVSMELVLPQTALQQLSGQAQQLVAGGVQPDVAAAMLWALSKLWQLLQQRQQQRLQQQYRWQSQQQQQQPVVQGSRPGSHRHMCSGVQLQPPPDLADPHAHACWLPQYLAASCPQWPSYSRRGLAVLLLALAGLQPQLTQPQAHALLATTAQYLPGSSEADLATYVWALGRLALQPPQAWLAAWCRYSLGRLSYFSTQGLAAACVGLAHLRYRPSSAWLGSLFDQLYWTVDQFNLPALAGVLWSLGRLGVPVPEELSQRLAVYAGLQLLQASYPAGQQQAGSATPAADGLPAATEVSGILDEAAMPTDRPPAAEQQAPPQQQQQQQQQIQQQQLLAEQQEQHEGQQQQQQGQGFRPHPQELAMVLSGVAAGSWQPSKAWLAAQLQLVLDSLPWLTPQGLVMCCRALAATGVELAPQHGAVLLQEVAGRLHGYQVQVPAAAVGSSSGTGQQQAYYQRVQQLEQEAVPQHPERFKFVVLSLSALLQLGVQLDRSECCDWLESLKEQLPAASAGEVHMLLGCCAGLRWQPSAAWAAALEACLLVLADRLDPEELLKLTSDLVSWQDAPALSGEVVGALKGHRGRLEASDSLSPGALERVRNNLRVLQAQQGHGSAQTSRGHMHGS